jgi:hypothetical protein
MKSSRKDADLLVSLMNIRSFSDGTDVLLDPQRLRVWLCDHGADPKSARGDVAGLRRIRKSRGTSQVDAAARSLTMRR